MTHRTSLYLFFVWLSVLGFVACDKRQVYEEPIPVGGHDYWPVFSAHTYVYRVDSIIFRRAGVRDTFSYRSTESLVDFLGVSQDTLVFWKRYMQPWYPDDSLPAHTVSEIRARGASRGRQYAHLADLVRLVFPASVGRHWEIVPADWGNGPAETIHGEQIYPFKGWRTARITTADGSYPLGDSLIGQVITVQEADAENLLERRYSRVEYAPGIGIVRQERRIMDTQLISTAPWEDKAQRGYICIKELISIE